MIHEESIGWQSPGNRSDARDRLPLRQSQSTNGREPRERSKVSCSGWPRSSNLFTSSVCVCVWERKWEVWYDNNMHHALCAHTHSQRCIFPFQIELHWADWIFFLLSIKDKNTPLLFSTLPASRSIQPVIIPRFSLPLKCVSSLKLCLVCIDFSPSPCRSFLRVCWSRMTVISLITQAVITHTHTHTHTHKWCLVIHITVYGQNVILIIVCLCVDFLMCPCVSVLRFFDPGLKRDHWLPFLSVLWVPLLSRSPSHKGIMVRGALSLTRSHISEPFWKVP